MHMIWLTIILPLVSLFTATLAEIFLNQNFGPGSATIGALIVAVAMGHIIAKRALPRVMHIWRAIPILMMCGFFSLLFADFANLEFRIRNLIGIHYAGLNARVAYCGMMACLCSVFCGWFLNSPLFENRDH